METKQAKSDHLRSPCVQWQLLIAIHNRAHQVAVDLGNAGVSIVAGLKKLQQETTQKVSSRGHNL